MKKKTIKKEEPEMTAFHFKMDTQMMDKLTHLELFEKTQSMSGMIKRILMQLFTIIEEEDYNGIQRFSKYKLINDDKDIKRVRVVVRIPDFLYRRLKSLHDTLNYFSIAQLVRDLLSWYLKLVDEFGEKYGDELMRIVHRWVKFSRNSEFLIKYIKQLLTFEGDIMDIIKAYNIYSLHFSPYRVFQLN
jgi:uncharacterized protein (UPF0297 family)